jgi:Zn-dependent metalloprotease
VRPFIALVVCSASLFGQASRQMPRHLVQESAAPSARTSPPSAALAHTSAVASAAGFSPADLAGLYVAREYTTAHNGVTHFRFKQQFAGVDVYGAEWAVNVDRDGRVLNSGGTRCAAPAWKAGAKAASSTTTL